MRIILFFISAFLLIICAQAADVFPSKPAGTILYINQTNLKFLDTIARFEVQRGQELVQADMAMVILEELPSNMTIENYAAGLFKSWEIGRNRGGRGILYVLVRKEGLLKIETSYELESLFPDAFIFSYQDTIKTFFNQEQLGDAISHLIVEMVKRVKDPDYQMAPFQQGTVKGQYLSGGAGVSEKGYVINRIEKILNLTKDDQGFLQKYPRAKTAAGAVDTFMISLKDGISSPFLGILTEGSQYMALEYRRTSGYQQNRYAEYQKVMPYNIAENDGYAVAFFQNNSVRPVYLRQDSQGLWMVDETRMWSNIDGVMEKEGLSYYPISFSHGSPWSFAFGGSKALRSEADRPNPLPVTIDLRTYIQTLENNLKDNPTSAQAYFDLADVLFFENYWVKDALSLMEKGLALDPLNERYLRRAIHLSVKLPDFSQTAKHYETLIKLHPDSKKWPKKYNCFKKYGTVCY